MMKKAGIGSTIERLKKTTSFTRNISMKRSKSRPDRKEFLNDNFLTENLSNDPSTHDSNASYRKTTKLRNPFQFLKKSRHTASSDSTNVDSSTFVEFTPLNSEDISDEAADDAYFNGSMAIFNVFKSKPENKEDMLLARINKLQKELDETNSVVEGLNKELEKIHTEKEDAARKLDGMIKWSVMNEESEHEDLRFIRMVLSDRSDLTDEDTVSFYERGFCSCLNN